MASPTLFLVAAEAGLRLFGYGYATSFFVRDEANQCYRANEKFGWRFYRPGVAKIPMPFSVPLEKPEETYRVFIVGSSAAWGTPSPSFSFGRVLEKMLRQRHPGVRLEVINTAMMGVNSHIVLPIVRECAAKQPDLFLIYLGNNECAGLYGPPADFMPSLPLIRVSLEAKSTRVGQLLRWAIRRDDPSADAAEPQDLEYFQQHRVAADDPQRAAVYDYFRGNLADMLQAAESAGAKTILSTVAVNLRDFPPLGSLHRADLTKQDLARWEAAYGKGIRAEQAGRREEAVEHYRAAAELDDRHADLHFRLARCHLAAGRFDEARKHYALACDLDAMPFRADSRVNEVIRQTAAGRSSGAVELVDAERALAGCERSDHGIPGDALFYEHVHLRFAGNYELAKAMLPAVEAAMCAKLGIAASANIPVPTQDECAALLGLTKWRECELAVSMVQLTSQPPFTGQLEHAERQSQAEKALKDIEKALGKEDLRQAIRAYDEAIRRTPDDWRLRYDRAFLCEAAGDHAGAAANLRAVLECHPWDVAVRLSLGHALAKALKYDEALAAYAEVLQAEPQQIDARRGVGWVLSAQGRYDEAADGFRKILDEKPGDKQAQEALAVIQRLRSRGDSAAAARRPADGATGLPKSPELSDASKSSGPSAEALEHYRRGNALYAAHKRDEAVGEYRRAVELCPGDAKFQNNLGATLLFCDKVDEAIPHLAKAVELDPKHARAHFLLGRALAAKGRTAEAIGHARRAVDLGISSPQPLAWLAWQLSTADDASLRNAADAVQYAKKACGMTDRKDPAALDALAAAYAASGRFDEAVQTATEAQRLASAAGDRTMSEAILQRITLYSDRRPFQQH